MTTHTTKQRILDSLAPVLAHSAYVSINEERLEAFAEELAYDPVPPWDNHLQFLGTPEQTMQYYFFLDSINCCFWAPKEGKRWKYFSEGEWLQGYYAFSKAIKDAFVRDERLFDASYVAEMSDTDFYAIFRGEGELLLLSERVAIIRENFAILRDTFGGSARTFFEAAECDVDRCVDLLCTHFPTFRDQEKFEGRTVYFLKRAQILPSDIAFALPDEPTVQFTNLDHLTVFADYKLPLILEAFGVLEYAPELLAKIDAEELIPRGSREEIEIRAHTIEAVERLRDAVERAGTVRTVREIDWILWVKAKHLTYRHPHHKTPTTSY